MTEQKRHVMLSTEALKMLQLLKIETDSKNYSELVLHIGECYLDELDSKRAKYLFGGMRVNEPDIEDIKTTRGTIE